MRRAAAITLFLAVVAQAAPPAPINLRAVRAGQSVTLTWNAVGGATGYRVVRGESTTGSVFTVAYANGTSVVDTDGGRVYYYRVAARDADWAEGPFSATVAAPLPPLLPAPTWVSAVRSGGRVTLSWTAISGASGYRVLRGGSSSGPFSTIGFANGTIATDSDAGSAYWYRVVAWDVFNREGALSAVVAVPLPAVPSAPSGVSAARSGTRVTLTWQATANAVGYRVLRSQSSSGVFGTLGYASGTSFTDNSSDVPYFYRVAAYDMFNREGAPSASAGSPFPVPPPAAPSGLKPGTGRVIGPFKLSWNAVSGAAAYDLELSTNGVAWTRQRVWGVVATPDLPVGNWLWRVRSVSGAQEGTFTSAAAVQVAAGYVLSVSPAPAPAAAAQEFRLSARAYRNPSPATLSVTGLPAGVSARFEPPTLSADGEMRLYFDGLETLTVPGDYPYTIQAAGAPIEGAVTGSLVVAGGFEISDLHAYPNPARSGWARIKISIGRTATTLRVRIFDLSGALVREIEEAAPFPSFRNPSFGVYEYEWRGANDAGRPVASEKYLYAVRAQSAAGEAQGRGILTFLWP